MKKKILLLGLILVFFAGLNTDALAENERKYPDMTVTISSEGTDYKIILTYSGANVASCDCYDESNEKYNLDLYMNSTDAAGLVHRWPGAGHLSSETLEWIVGPNNYARWALRYESNCSDCTWPKNDVYWVWSGFPVATSSTHPSPYSELTDAATVPIKSPENLTASNLEYFDKIVLSWGKGSDIPDEHTINDIVYNLSYNIYRGETNDPAQKEWVTTLPANARSWTDNDVRTDEQFYYWVTTSTEGWGGHESEITTDNAVLGTSKAFTVEASDGTYTGKVKIEWIDLSSFAEEIRIERSIPNNTGKEEVEILSRNSTSYYDLDIIPGYSYIYYVTPIKQGRTFLCVSDNGYGKPNGTISGFVKSLLNSGVSGVQVCATLVTDIPAGADAMPQNGYCATTDADGRYEIRDIYFFDAAEFSIVPYKGTHIFTPGSIVRRLDMDAKISSGANFTDESVFTVRGKVFFPVTSNDTCGIPNVEIKINGQSRGKFTNPDGSWDYSFQDEGTYTFEPVFLHHQFENSSHAASTTIYVDQDFTNLNFTDVEKDEIKVRVLNGCGGPIAENFVKATISVTSTDNCYNQTIDTDVNGLVTITNLPAREYNVQVTALTPVNSVVFDQIGNNPVTVDLTIRDTIETVEVHENMVITPGSTTILPNGTTVVNPPDTTYSTVNETIREVVVPAADFIYHSPLNISVNFEDAGAIVTDCQKDDGDFIVLMEQNVSYPLIFNVTETLGSCQVKEGNLRIFDGVSDREDKPVDVPIVNGIATYKVTAGMPEIATSTEHNHEKFLLVIPEVDFLEAESKEYWILVTGVQTHDPSFTTRSPELPLLILHDPPGDKSSAFVEKGTEIRSFETTEIHFGAEVGAYANLVIGAKVLTPFSANGVGTVLNFKVEGGTDKNWKHGLETTITFKDKFSTSDMDVLTGEAGDVYIGASFNQKFALGDELSYDEENCTANIDLIPTVDINGFATTFVYTEKHIISTLLPTLGILKSAIIAGRDTSQLNEEEKLQYNQLLYDSLHWETVVAKNRASRDTNAIFNKNISFSAGAPVSSEYSCNTKNSQSIENNAFVNT